mgnify:FL=1
MATALDHVRAASAACAPQLRSASPAESAGAAPAGPPRGGPVIWDFGPFLALDLPKPEPLLAPVLVRGAVTLLRGPRGVGKSWLALAMAHAVAIGASVFGWRAPADAAVLYVDGATPLGILQARLSALERDAEFVPGEGSFRLLASAAQPEPIDLSTRLGVAVVERAIADGCDLLVLDGMEALVRPGARAAGAAWAAVRDWLDSLRRRGIGVLVVDSAQGRACHRYDTVVDFRIALRPPARWDAADGVHCDVMVEAARGRVDGRVRPFTAKLEMNGGTATWTRTCSNVGNSVALLLHHQGLSIRAIAARLGLSPTEAWRKVDRARRLIAPDAATLARAAHELAAWAAADPPPAPVAAPQAAQTGGTKETSGTPETAEMAGTAGPTETTETAETLGTAETTGTGETVGTSGTVGTREKAGTSGTTGAVETSGTAETAGAAEMPGTPEVDLSAEPPDPVQPATGIALRTAAGEIVHPDGDCGGPAGTLPVGCDGD